jgi:hypothetical protein
MEKISSLLSRLSKNPSIKLVRRIDPLFFFFLKGKKSLQSNGKI